jgi:7 transmembrane receptor (rhodopsin family)
MSTVSSLITDDLPMTPPGGHSAYSSIDSAGLITEYLSMASSPISYTGYADDASRYNGTDDGVTGEDPGVSSPGLSDDYQRALIVLYSVTTSLAVLGNLVVIVVLAVGRRSKNDLRAFLLNLAVADLTMAVFCMPFTFTTTMLHDWIFGAAMCTVVLFLQVSIVGR